MNSDKQLSFITRTSVVQINPEHWKCVVDNRNIYLTLPYLRALEKGKSGEMGFFYSLIYKGGIPVAVAVFQLVRFEYKKSLQRKTLFKHLSDEQNEDGNISMNILVCGNAFSDGENGFLWTDQISASEAIAQIVKIAEQIKQDKSTRDKLSVVLFKEFWPSSLSYSDILKKFKYKDFMIDVNMVLQIHRDWKSKDDYLFSMKTKFRTKANAAYRKSSSLKIQSLTAEDILYYADSVNELFDNVLERSNYSFGKMDAETFAEIKLELGKSFSFRGLFYEQKLVGFSTSFFHNAIMEANYVGIDYQYNIAYAVYQRLLYDYVEQAISMGKRELHLGRTSEQIKSSLGAEPVNMTLYARHKKAVSHILMSSILGYVSPSKFELRKPFKANFKDLSTQ